MGGAVMGLFKSREPKVVYMNALYPMGGLTFSIACMHCKHNSYKYNKDVETSMRCDLCIKEIKSGFEVGKCLGSCGNATPPTPCRTCNHYHAYVNAKQGRGLCDYFMHEMPADGYCSEHGKGGKDE